jgi:hypothetical protein
MATQRIILLVITILGGTAVLGSYAHGLITRPNARGALWGNVPGSLVPLYTAWMLPAALGFLACTYFILFRLNPDEARVAGRFSYQAFYWIYILILAPSALWMPLTFLMINRPSLLLWIIIRIVLALVGLGSIALMAALLAVHPSSPAWAHRLAIIGCVAFAFQTVILDAIVWPVFFPLKY